MARLDYKAIAQAADMEDVLAALGMEIHHGKALCPFHDDRKPSMQIYHDGYHCFVCGAHGDAIDLVQGVEHCTRREAAQRVAHIAGGVLIAASLDTQRRQTERKRLEAAYNADVARRYELDEAIAAMRSACYNLTPYSEAWCAAYRRLDALMAEWEDVDARIIHENNRRYREKHEHKRTKGRGGEVLRSGGVCADSGNH